MNSISIAIAVILDIFLGDPGWLPHPVRWMGKLIAVLEMKLFPVKRAKRIEYFAGCLLCIVVTGISASLCIIIILIAGKISPSAVLIVNIIIGFYCISARSLIHEANIIRKYLLERNLISARKALSMIVGRDTENLKEQDIICAAVETVAENITDGIISPLFYLALGGPVAAIAFKAVSTMDSMIGYKSKRYRYFGTCAARLDDILNFIPARLTAFFLIPLASLLFRFDWKQSFKIVLRDRLKHESPNSAHGESAMAGALGIQLGGGAFYSGIFSKRPFLGDNLRIPVECDILKSAWITFTVTIIMVILVCGVLVAKEKLGVRS